MKIQHTRVSMTRKLRFDSSVISHGSKTLGKKNAMKPWFDSSVISHGSKTDRWKTSICEQFESNVISYRKYS